MVARALPKGWPDLLRQIVLFCGAYGLYRVVRGQVEVRAVDAFQNAREIIGVERSLGLFFEPHAYAWSEAHEWIAGAASWMYVNSHFTVTTAALAFLYLRRNERFYFVRNTFMVAMAIALAGYVAFPTAPPRLLPEWGFGDPVADFTGVDAQTSGMLVNMYAAVPSMHVAFALLLAAPMASTARHRPVRMLWRAYPAVVTFVVIATANHWWMDAVLGTATAAVAALAAQALLARARPDIWAWDPSRGAGARRPAEGGLGFR